MRSIAPVKANRFIHFTLLLDMSWRCNKSQFSHLISASVSYNATGWARQLKLESDRLYRKD